MPEKLTHQIPGNIPSGVIRGQHLNVGELPQKIVANELFECSLVGEASELYGELGPNLISCKLDNVTFPYGVSHFDAKDTLFLHCQIRHKFDRIMATQCAFRDVLLSGSTMRDTVFVDSVFEDVTFSDCDFSVTSFKSNIFRGCSFLRCTTSNKLFEHCLFYDCKFLKITLQEGSILQNYGIHLGDTIDLDLYRAETGESLTIEDLKPRNRLERISLEYFVGANLNVSQDLFEIVHLNFDDATKTNILHMVTGIRQLASFLLFLYSEGRVLLYFPLRLFWSIDQFLESYGEKELPHSVLEALEISAARLRRAHEEVCLAASPSGLHYLLVSEEYSERDLKNIIGQLGIDIEIQSFERFNSPSLAAITSPEALELLLFLTVALSTRFRAEVDSYQAKRKLIDIGSRLISDGKTNPTAAYQALVALNVPKFIYIRLSARISLPLLGRLRRMILALLEDPPSYRREQHEHPKAEQVPPVTILFLAANPIVSARLQLDQEVKEIDEALRASGTRERFRLEESWAAGEREMQDSLLRYEPDIVHLSTHGAFSGRPLLEDKGSRQSGRALINQDGDLGVNDWEEIRGLAQIFAAAGRHISCLVLNSCFSAKISESISPYVDCIIGMSEAILDDAAIRFSWSFYNSLGYGKSIKVSFDLATAQLALAGYGQSQGPKLFAGRRDPGDVILVSRPKCY